MLYIDIHPSRPGYVIESNVAPTVTASTLAAAAELIVSRGEGYECHPEMMLSQVRRLGELVRERRAAAPVAEIVEHAPAYAKAIQYDGESRDFAMYLDGELVGFARTYADAETRLDELVHDILTHAYGRAA